MDKKFSIRFTGKYLNKDKDSTVANVSSFFSNMNNEKVETIISKKMVFKKDMDFSIANKIKYKFESVGAECLVFSQASEDDYNIFAADNQESSHRGGDKKRGLAIITLSLVLMFSTLLLSDGYDPRMGFFWNLSNSMYVVRGYPFGCETGPYYHLIEESERNLAMLDCSESLYIKLKSNHALFVLLCLMMCGVLRYLGVVKPVRFYWEAVKKNIEYRE
jgi:hypothetical protein